MRGEAGPARQGKRAPGIAVSVESWRVDDAPTLSSTQTAVRNLSRLVWLILVSVFWRERLAHAPCTPLAVVLLQTDRSIFGQSFSRVINGEVGCFSGKTSMGNTSLKCYRVLEDTWRAVVKR